jgi:phosphoribosyl 1,2-cyclic phosphate phosphodiesterase
VKLTFLGTGTSFGVPQIGCRCEVCHSTDARDRRTRVGAVVEADDGTRLLVDTPPELRLQLVAAGVDHLDAVLFTHEHADHTHGIDDLRALTVRRAGGIPLYGPPETLTSLASRFPYIFDPSIRPLPGTSKPEGSSIPLKPGVATRIGGAVVTAFEVPHGHARVYGYRIGGLGYVTDAKSLPPEALAALQGVDVLVLNALLRTPHPTHFSVPEAIEAAAAVGARRTFLTHLSHAFSHELLARELPPGISPAHDGLVVEL